MPICDAAPGRFSTTTLWFRDFDRYSATMRAVRSVPPPGANGTMMRTVWLGYAGACDQAAAEMSTALNAKAMATILRDIEFLPMGRTCCFRLFIVVNRPGSARR